MAVAMDVVFNHASGDSLLKDYDGPTSDSADGIYFYDRCRRHAAVTFTVGVRGVTVG